MNYKTTDFLHTKATDAVASHHSEMINLFYSLDCRCTHRVAITDQTPEMSLPAEPTGWTPSAILKEAKDGGWSHEIGLCLKTTQLQNKNMGRTMAYFALKRHGPHRKNIR
jgi:hypothetical protein